MAIFGLKKRKDDKLEQEAQVSKNLSDKKIERVQKKIASKAEKASKAVSKVVSPVLHSGTESVAASVIIRPHVTEKSGILSQGGVYTFEVSKDANKVSVSKAIVALYKVTPVKIAIVNIPPKNVFVRGRKGVVSGIKKAVVTVKKGDKIDFV